jgi:hypothetical protein
MARSDAPFAVHATRIESMTGVRFRWRVLGWGDNAEATGHVC